MDKSTASWVFVYRMMGRFGLNRKIKEKKMDFFSKANESLQQPAIIQK